MKKTNKNFTLVELLCAVGLVVILAGIGFSAYSYASHRGKEAATRSLINRLAAGLETLKTKHGLYPACDGFSTIAVTVNTSTGLISKIKFGTASGAYEIDTDASDAVKKKAFQAQMKDFLAVVDGESLKKYVSNGLLTDAWGGEIRYCYPGKINKTKFDLVAPGADERFGTGPAETPPDALDSYKTSGEWACDDIANFK